MKIVCPRCYARLRISEQKIPPEGGWACCPKCGEKFFVNPHAQADLKNIEIKGNNHRNITPKRSEISQKLLNRLKAHHGAGTANIGEPVYEPDKLLIVLLDEKKIPINFYQAGLWCLILIPIVYFFISFGSNLSKPDDIKESAALELINNESNKDLIRNDLLELKRNTLRQPSFSRHVKHTGSESRIFKYFMAILAPDACQQIESLVIFSEDSLNGFKVRANCFGESQNSHLLMELKWTDKTACVSFPSYPGEEEFETFLSRPFDSSP